MCDVTFDPGCPLARYSETVTTLCAVRFMLMGSDTTKAFGGIAYDVLPEMVTVCELPGRIVGCPSSTPELFACGKATVTAVRFSGYALNWFDMRNLIFSAPNVTWNVCRMVVSAKYTP